MIYTVPLIALTALVAAMMVIVLMFDQSRGTRLKDWLARLWPLDRRRRLHLEDQNGFLFFLERLIDWSDTIVRLSWIVALPAFAGGSQPVLFASFLISLCFLARSGSLTYLAAKRIKRFATLLGYDGFGVYAQTADGWRGFEQETRPSLILSAMATAASLLSLVVL